MAPAVAERAGTGSRITLPTITLSDTVKPTTYVFVDQGEKVAGMLQDRMPLANWLSLTKVNVNGHAALLIAGMNETDVPADIIARHLANASERIFPVEAN
jgi:hypothetical protein